MTLYIWIIGVLAFWAVYLATPQYRKDLQRNTRAQTLVVVAISIVPFVNLLAAVFGVAALFDLGIVSDWLEKPTFKKD